MSEEALGSRNKDIRNFRQFFARKNSRLNNITDVLNHLMITSDPLFDKFRGLKHIVSSNTYLPEMLNLLQKEPEIAMDLDEFEC